MTWIFYVTVQALIPFTHSEGDVAHMVPPRKSSMVLTFTAEKTIPWLKNPLLMARWIQDQDCLAAYDIHHVHKKQVASYMLYFEHTFVVTCVSFQSKHSKAGCMSDNPKSPENPSMKISHSYLLLAPSTR